MATLELLNYDGLEAFEKVRAMNFSFVLQDTFFEIANIVDSPKLQPIITTNK